MFKSGIPDLNYAVAQCLPMFTPIKAQIFANLNHTYILLNPLSIYSILIRPSTLCADS